MKPKVAPLTHQLAEKLAAARGISFEEALKLLGYAKTVTSSGGTGTGH